MISAANGGEVEENVSCGGIACSASAEIQTKVQYVVKVQACLLDHSLHQLLICPPRWDRGVEAETGLRLLTIPRGNLNHRECAAKQGESSVAAHRCFRLGEKRLQQLGGVKSDAVDGADRLWRR